MPTVRINHQPLVTVLIVIAAVLALASFGVNFCTRHLGIENVPFDHMLAVAAEANIPTFFSTMILAAAALLLWVIASAGSDPRAARPWKALSFIFLYLALDEAAMIHELSRKVPRHWLPDWGIFYWPWVAFGTVAVIVLIAAFWRFLLALPKPTRNRFLVAGAVFVFGALGLEFVGAAIMHGEMPELALVIEETVEEFLEMLGVILFIRALLLHMADHLPRVSLRVNPQDDTTSESGPGDDAEVD